MVAEDHSAATAVAVALGQQEAHQAVVTAQALMNMVMNRAWHRASTYSRANRFFERLSACMGLACSSESSQESEVRSLLQLNAAVELVKNALSCHVSC